MGGTNSTGTVQDLSTAGRRKWLSEIKKQLEKSPILPNVVLGLILAGLEKLVEMEFECPCKPKYNQWFASAYFVIPAIVASFLFCIIYKNKKEAAFFSCVQSVVWVILLFLDGRYFACAQTDWTGRFVIVDNAAPLKWCEPANRNSSQEFMIKSQKWYSLSQVIGIGLLIFFPVLLGIITCIFLKEEEQGQGSYCPPVEQDVTPQDADTRC